MADSIRTKEEKEWIDYTENLLLRLDEQVFPDERHALLNTSDIVGSHITYQDEHASYFFNDEEYLKSLRGFLERTKVPPDMAFYEVQKTGVILSVYALRTRAWEIHQPPKRSVLSVKLDTRIPWEVKRMLTSNATINQYDKISLGARAKTKEGMMALQNLDLIIMGELASHWYRNAHPISWIKQFILT